MRWYYKLMQRLKSGRNIFFFSYILFVVIVKGGFFHFHYYPFMDDWHLLGEPNLFNSNLDFVLSEKTYAFRPAFAFISALFVSPMWAKLGICLFVMCCLHAFNGILAVNLMGIRQRALVIPFLLFFGLFPLATEGEYWLSASLSTVLGVFCVLCSLKCMSIVQNQPVVGRLILYISGFVLLLIGLGCYEQVITFFIVYVAIVLSKWRKQGKSIFLKIIISVSAIMIIVGYYAYFTHHSVTLASRADTVSSLGQLISNSGAVVSILYNLWFGPPDTGLFSNGILRGVHDVIVYRSYKYLVGVLALVSIVIWSFLSRHDTDHNSENNNHKQLIRYFGTGMCLFIAAYGPFFISKENWISDRSTYVPLIGLSLMLSSIMCWLAEISRHTRFVIGGVLSVYALATIFVSISETVDYTNSSLYDQKIVRKIVDQANGQGPTNVLLLNSSYSFTPQNAMYHEHIQSSLSVGWAASDMAAVLSRQRGYYNVIPVIVGVPVSKAWLPQKCLVFGLDHGQLHRLKELPSLNGIQFYRENGSLFGSLTYDPVSSTYTEH